MATFDVWYRSCTAVYTFLPTWQATTRDQAEQFFRDVIVKECDIWVAAPDDNLLGFLAMRGSYIDRLYIDPEYWRLGWGTGFVDFAKQLSPGGLELHTHVENHVARALYEKHRFQAVKFGLSPPPESAPDVEYHWRPEEDQKKNSALGFPVRINVSDS
jgi:ribosomal protein S18 acetylase RimI-like enzyme